MNLQTSIGIRRIIAQVARHAGLGFTKAHDDAQTRHQLAKAALSYIGGDMVWWRFRSRDFHQRFPRPFAKLHADWTPAQIDDRIHDLERAGSFVIAEIDRLARHKERLLAQARKPDDDEEYEGGAGVPRPRIPPAPPTPAMREFKERCKVAEVF